MGFFSRIFGSNRRRERLRPLYDAAVAAARRPDWYREGQVPDTLDGRFDMIAAVLALIFIRLEQDGFTDREAPALLTEIFVADMEDGLRQIGIGDLVVGKHIGRLVGALGGRLSAFRTALGEGASLEEPVRRNIFRGAPPSDEAVEVVAARLLALHHALARTSGEALMQGRFER